MLMAIYKCSYYPSSKKVLLTANRGQARNSPMNTMQRTRDYKEPRLSRYSYITALASMAKGASWNKGSKTVKAGILGSLLCMAFLRKGCMNKT